MPTVERSRAADGGESSRGRNERANASEIDDRRDGENARAAVRGDADPAARCPYCGQPFHEERLETLHRGLEHPAEISNREQAAFERAYGEEEREIRWFRLQALGALVLVYFCMLFLYAFVT